MCKRLLCAVLCISVVLAFSGCTELAGDTSSRYVDTDSQAGDAQGDTNSQDQTTSNLKADPTSEPSKQDMDIEILSSHIGEDYSQAPILVIEYRFINNTDEAKSFTFLCQDTAYQNGIECTSTVISDEIDTQQQLNDIKPGVEYTLKVGYKLQDTETPVEIEIMSFLKSKTFLQQTIDLT